MHGLPPKNGHTGRRAENIAFVRLELQQAIKDRRAAGKPLNHDVLTACKYLLAIEGVSVESGTRQPRKQPKPKKEKKFIKPPSLMDAVPVHAAL